MTLAANKGVRHMRGTVIVSFARDRDYEFRIPTGEKNPLSAEEAQRWLAQQFEEFGCAPRSLVGKVLTLDKVLEVARGAGEKRFAEGGAWAERYARAVVAALNRETVRVDVAQNTAG
jgi:hypothetical protein